MNCLDQMVLIMGDKRLSAQKFNDIFRLLCSEYSSARIPGSLDQVHIGEAGHMRTDNTKHTVVLGMCENEFPRASDGGALLSEKELCALKDMGVDAGESGEYSTYREKLFFYLEAARPSEGLHLMWRTNDMAGSELTKSSFLLRVEKILPNVVQKDFDSCEADPVCLTEAFDYLLENYDGSDERLSGLYGYFSQHPLYKNKLSYLDAVAQSEKAPVKLSEKHFEGKNMYMSQSSFEKYINCHYSYFISNMLGAKAQKRARVDFSIVGPFVHAVLERFMQVTSGTLKDAVDEEILRITNEIVQEYIAETLPDFDNSTPRFKYLIKRISKTAYLVVQSLAAELRQSEFTPLLVEQRIGDGVKQPYEIPLCDGSKLIFKGIVDRVDI